MKTLPLFCVSANSCGSRARKPSLESSTMAVRSRRQRRVRAGADLPSRTRACARVRTRVRSRVQSNREHEERTGLLLCVESLFARGAARSQAEWRAAPPQLFASGALQVGGRHRELNRAALASAAAEYHDPLTDSTLQLEVPAASRPEMSCRCVPFVLRQRARARLCGGTSTSGWRALSLRRSRPRARGRVHSRGRRSLRCLGHVGSVRHDSTAPCPAQYNVPCDRTSGRRRARSHCGRGRPRCVTHRSHVKRTEAFAFA